MSRLFPPWATGAQSLHHLSKAGVPLRVTVGLSVPPTHPSVPKGQCWHFRPGSHGDRAPSGRRCREAPVQTKSTFRIHPQETSGTGHGNMGGTLGTSASRQVLRRMPGYEGTLHPICCHSDDDDGYYYYYWRQEDRKENELSKDNVAIADGMPLLSHKSGPTSHLSPAEGRPASPPCPGGGSEKDQQPKVSGGMTFCRWRS